MAVNKTTKNTSNATKLTPFEKECIEVIKQINEYKLIAEANAVTTLYKTPDLIRETSLKLEDLNNNTWKVYFSIANDIINVEKKNTLDELTVNMYLSKHAKLRNKFEEYGGYDTIANATEYIKEENYESYVSEIKKWNAVMKLAKIGFPVKDRLSEFVDIKAEDIYNEFEALLNHTFLNVETDIKTYDISYDIDELIDKLDKGIEVGLPYYHLPLITKETGGMRDGCITLIGGLSNTGKSSFLRNALIPSVINNQEKLVVMLNEDTITKWQRELLVFVVNTVIKFDLQKHIVRDGKYSPEVKEALVKAADWIKEKTQNHIITIVPFSNYKTDNVIKCIRKFKAMGCCNFALDTYKLDSGKVSDNSWLQLQQNMVTIYDCIKKEVCDVHITITFQLSKGSVKQRYYTQDNIGMAKNIIDVAETCIMIRDLIDTEYTGERNELKVYRLEGKNGTSKIPVKLDKDKHYQVVFLIKNREGANNFQVVIEHDLSRNLLREVGICNVPMDF